MPTHGSLTKAGKVRSQTPKIESENKKKQSPKRRNRAKYKLATTCPNCRANIGVYATRCWKCKVKLQRKGMRPIIKQRKSLSRRDI